MTDTDGRTRGNEHCTDEECADFVRGLASPSSRASLQSHLDAGCARCRQAVALWRTVSGIAQQEASYLPPVEALRQVSGEFALRRPPGLARRLAGRAAVLLDSFRQPLTVGVRSVAAATAPRQLLYKAGRYTIRLRLEPAEDATRMSIVGQILNEQDPTGSLQDIAVLALKGSQTLDRTLTNSLGEFLLEPAAAEDLQLCVGVDEIGTFTVQPPRTAKVGSSRRKHGPRRAG